jgi:hypothetical protein
MEDINNNIKIIIIYIKINNNNFSWIINFIQEVLVDTINKIPRICYFRVENPVQI